MAADVIRGTIWEGQSFTVLSRLIGLDGGFIVQADLPATDGIVLKIFDVTQSNATPDTPIAQYNETGTGDPTADTTLAKATAIKTALTVDGYWDVDSTGYSFIHTINDLNAAGTDHFTMKGGKTYRAEYAIDANSGTPKHGTVFVVVEIKVKGVLSS